MLQNCYDRLSGAPLPAPAPAHVRTRANARPYIYTREASWKLEAASWKLRAAKLKEVIP